MPVHLRLSKTVDMNTRRFKPDWEMNASTLLQASPSRRPSISTANLAREASSPITIGPATAVRSDPLVEELRRWP